MSLARLIYIRRERERQRREGATDKEKRAVSPLLWDTFLGEKQLQRSWKAQGVPTWKRIIRGILIQD